MKNILYCNFTDDTFISRYHYEATAEGGDNMWPIQTIIDRTSFITKENLNHNLLGMSVAHTAATTVTKDRLCVGSEGGSAALCITVHFNK